jgi:RHS repeat-associated protein
MGSVRTATGDTGALEDRYEYDAFGQPYAGNLDGMMNLGYTGKPYDAATGMYNYGYRDYRPQAARFTTVDPVRDGNNWYAYVNNDPVNYVDLWGLEASDTENFDSYIYYGEDPVGITLTANVDDNKWHEKIDDFFIGVYQKATEFHFEAREALNKDLPTYNEVIKDPAWTLLTPEMSRYHDNGIDSPELKYINKDGREAIYTKDSHLSPDGSYILYTDPQYKGTYNYVTPLNPFYYPGHFFADMLPYYLLGNDRK